MRDYNWFPDWAKAVSKWKTALKDIVQCLEWIKAIDDLWEILLEHMYYRKDFISMFFDWEMEKVIESDEYSFQQYFISLKLPPEWYVHKFADELIDNFENIRIEIGKKGHTETLARLDFIIKDNCIHLYFIDHYNEK